jgi:hypothetical protein
VGATGHRRLFTPVALKLGKYLRRSRMLCCNRRPSLLEAVFDHGIRYSALRAQLPGKILHLLERRMIDRAELLAIDGNCCIVHCVLHCAGLAGGKG